MRMDLENQLSVVQAFAGGPTVSTNSYWKMTAAADPSIGRRMALLIFPTVAAGAGTSALIELIQADDAALTVNVNSIGSITVAAALLVPGNQFELPCPQGAFSQLYLGARVTLTGGVATVTLDIFWMPQDEIARFKSFINVTPVYITSPA
jgi:hypothetical protein